MYRKYKENKDNEYETIIKKQVNESRLVAEHEGITIPKTLDDYVAPSRAGALGLNSGKNAKRSVFNALSHEDDVDLGIDDDDDQMADMADDDDGSYDDSD
ncbi:unnamed protein product [Rotaria magnacalcarata]|nr:unnamed protein product [Rotaria magnacalcarata]CAF3839739.1 unnamed protein product [Rotaria magnacalcarata]